MFSLISKINAGMKKIEEFIVGYGTIALAFLLIANVIDRNLFGSRLYFVDEVNTFLIIYITFVGTSYAARNGRHIRMSALSDLVPKRFEKLMMYIMTLGTFIFIGWTTWIVSKYVVDLFSSGRQSSLLQVPLWSIWIIAPIGLGLTTIHYFMAFLKNLKEEDVWISFDEKSEYGEVEEIIEKVGVSELEEEDNEK
ncbi:MAG: TRAP transporter small permease [Halarsenatibacteraceae bacterium]